MFFVLFCFLFSIFCTALLHIPQESVIPVMRMVPTDGARSLSILPRGARGGACLSIPFWRHSLLSLLAHWLVCRPMTDRPRATENRALSAASLALCDPRLWPQYL